MLIFVCINSDQGKGKVKKGESQDSCKTENHRKNKDGSPDGDNDNNGNNGSINNTNTSTNNSDKNRNKSSTNNDKNDKNDKNDNNGNNGNKNSKSVSFDLKGKVPTMENRKDYKSHSQTGFPFSVVQNPKDPTKTYLDYSNEHVRFQNFFARTPNQKVIRPILAHELAYHRRDNTWNVWNFGAKGIINSSCEIGEISKNQTVFAYDQNGQKIEYTIINIGKRNAGGDATWEVARTLEADNSEAAIFRVSSWNFTRLNKPRMCLFRCACVCQC